MPLDFEVIVYMTNAALPLISVVLPVYNSGKTLGACLQCLQKQTYPNLEIVAVYLASEDDTLAKLQAFSGRSLRIVYQQEKNGPGGARNLGVAAAKGAYIGFMEADDIVPSDFYEQLFTCIHKEQSDIAVGVTLSQGKPMGQPGAGVVKGFSPSFSRLPHGGCFDKLFKAELIKPLRFADYIAGLLEGSSGKFYAASTLYVYAVFMECKLLSQIARGSFYGRPANDGLYLPTTASNKPG